MTCALHAARRGRKVQLLDHGNVAGRKVAVSGGGKCNFTNMELSAENYYSRNPHFCKSALAGFGAWDAIDFFSRGSIGWEEREHGRIFTTSAATDVVDYLMESCRSVGVRFGFDREVKSVAREGDGFVVHTNQSTRVWAKNVVVALGGPSWPQVGATAKGYEIARSFGLDIVPPRPALAPVIMNGPDWPFAELSGVSLPVSLHCAKTMFADDLLFTHTGLSGPAILQASCLIEAGDRMVVDLLPGQDLASLLEKESSRQRLKNWLGGLLPSRLPGLLLPQYLAEKPVAALNSKERTRVADHVHRWQVVPDRLGGSKKAEVTLGGVDTKGLDSKTMQVREVPGLYFIGEVVDVTGQLGGYNLHWAWASAVASS
jgi:predicted Rossmann fold flavoprotein